MPNHEDLSQRLYELADGFDDPNLDTDGLDIAPILREAADALGARSASAIVEPTQTGYGRIPIKQRSSNEALLQWADKIHARALSNPSRWGDLDIIANDLVAIFSEEG